MERKQKFCQSCGMPLADNNDFGTNADGSLNEEYCKYCFVDGKFVQQCTMDEMIEHCAQFVEEFNKDSEHKMTREEAIGQMKMFFPHLKWWRKENRDLQDILQAGARGVYENDVACKAAVSFNTIGLFTTDNAKMVAFYRDIFGFHTEWNGIDPNVEMTLGGSRIIMFPRDAFEQMTSQQYAYPKGTNGTMEISFDVPRFADVDKEYERAVSMGAKPIFAPTTEPWGQRTCYVADPEGNLIEISSFIEG